MHLHSLSRLLTQPWAMRRETLIAKTQEVLAELSGQARPKSPHADTTWNELQWDRENGKYVREKMKTQPGYTMLNLEGVIASLRGTLPPVPENVSVFLVWGMLGRAWSETDRWFYDPVDADELAQAIAATPEGQTVVLWFRSPGGTSGGIPETAEVIRAAGQRRTVVAFTDDLCASAAYWLASQCEQIVATPTAMVGSIGVYLAFYDYTGYLEQMGLKLELFKAGRLKAMGLPGNSLSDEEGKHLQALVDKTYSQFTADVLANRELATDTMQGQTFEGENALAANLVDRFAGSAHAFFASLGKR